MTVNLVDPTPGVMAVSLEISQARALVRFPGCRATQEAARRKIGFEQEGKKMEKDVGFFPGFIERCGLEGHLLASDPKPSSTPNPPCSR
jgi:hypothetical protein